MPARELKKTRPRWLLVSLLMVLLTMVLAACSGEGSDVTLPEGVTLPEVTVPEVEAPEVEVPDVEVPEVEVPEVEVPDVEAPAPEAEDDGSSAPLWALVLLGLIIVAFIAYFGARSGSKRQAQPAPVQQPAAPPQSAPPAAWKEDARSAYADSRWLYDEMTVELATWRGDTLFEAQVSNSTAALNTTHQAAWNQLPSRVAAARDALYRIESVNDPHVSQVATALQNQLNSTRSAVDRLADARRQRRTVEAVPTADSAAIDEVRGAESRAADDLAAERRRLGDATSGLSALI